MQKNRFIALLALAALSLGLSACSPEVGSEKWCQNIEQKPKGDVTGNEAADYTKHCLFRTDDK